MSTEKIDTVTRSECAKKLRVCNHTIKRWENRGLLTPIRINARVIRYRVCEIEKLLAEAAA